MAISKTYIDRNLSALDVKFRKAKTPKDTLIYSKAAILELAGWVEVSMDEVFFEIARKRLIEADNVKLYKEAVKRNYGFEYDDHFRVVLGRGIGLITVEKVEKLADQAKLTKLKAELKNLIKARNSLAHTYIKGTAVSIDAPSATRARFVTVYEGLKEVERVIWAVI